MKIEQMRWTQGNGWEPTAPGRLGDAAQMVLLFGSTAVLKEQRHLDEISQAYPNAHLLGCSTSGEIYQTQVFDESLVATAIQFEATQIQGVRIKLSDGISSFEAGERLVKELDRPGLVHVFVLSEGLKVNGSQLVDGLTKHLPSHIAITGGMSGDGTRFQETLVFWDSVPEKEVIAAIGLYSDRLRVGYGSLGGLDSYGPERLITRSKDNVLYELDGKSALSFYKTYLGEYAQGLPAIGGRFPLSLRISENTRPVVRTVLAVNEDEQSMTFTADMPEGAYARFMKANCDRLVDGAIGAAKTSYEAVGSSSPDLAVLVSCISRKLVLKQRIEEEVEGVRDVLGDRTVFTGFYSYGEISPFTPGTRCELHNQTMTITTFSER
jgi:hypothetical protein